MRRWPDTRRCLLVLGAALAVGAALPVAGNAQPGDGRWTVTWTTSFEWMFDTVPTPERPDLRQQQTRILHSGTAVLVQADGVLAVESTSTRFEITGRAVQGQEYFGECSGFDIRKTREGSHLPDR